MTEPARNSSQQGQVEKDLWYSDIFSWTRKEMNSIEEFRNTLRSYDSPLARYLADVEKKSPAGRFRKTDTYKLETLIIVGYGKNRSLPPLQLLDKLILNLNPPTDRGALPEPI